MFNNRHKMTKEELRDFWESQKGKLYVYRAGSAVEDIVRVVGTHHPVYLVAVQSLSDKKIHMYHYKACLLTPLMPLGAPALA